MAKLPPDGVEPSADDPRADAFSLRQFPITQPIKNTPLEEPLFIRLQAPYAVVEVGMEFGVVLLLGWGGQQIHQMEGFPLVLQTEHPLIQAGEPQGAFCLAGLPPPHRGDLQRCAKLRLRGIPAGAICHGLLKFGAAGMECQQAARDTDGTQMVP